MYFFKFENEGFVKCTFFFNTILYYVRMYCVFSALGNEFIGLSLKKFWILKLLELYAILIQQLTITGFIRFRF